MITVLDNFSRDEIRKFKKSDVFNKEILYSSDNLTVIKWMFVNRIAVYIPKDKEKDLSELPSDLQNIITKERL